MVDVTRKDGVLVPLCTIRSCSRPAYVRGWCGFHYGRQRRLGDPEALPQNTPWGAASAFLIDHAADDDGPCLIWPFSRFPDGRARVHFKKRYMPAARAMCELAHGKPPTAQHEAAHSCGKGHDGCVHPKHLRWATSAENHNDKVLHGTALRGETVPRSKLTTADVLEIRRLASIESRAVLAEKFGVTKSCINAIVLRHNWRHV